MSTRLRFAVLASPETRLVRQLQAMPGHPVIQVFRDLYGDAAGVSAFSPRLLIVECGPGLEQDLGAVRVLASLLPEMAVIVVCDAAARNGLEATCQESDILLLPSPFSPTELQQTIAKALNAAPGTHTESYLQFVQGICDEINNPLMFATGHLQLLRARLEPDSSEATLAQLTSICNGLDRISRTMQKVGTMSRATFGDRLNETFAVGSLLANVEEQLRDTEQPVAFDCPDEVRVLQMQGDMELLTGALLSLCQAGWELASEPEDDLAVAVARHGDHVEVCMRVRNPKLQEWELPDAFEPYHLNRILRGSTLGLNLFLVRLVIRAHGGDAVARRVGEHEVEFVLGLV